MTLSLLKSITGRVLVESHRGAEHLAPENSQRGLEIARQVGADFIEVDVQLSRDGVAFLRHNYSLPDGRACREVTWSELEELTIQGEKQAKLEDVLLWARQVDAQLSLDLKTAFMPEGRLTDEVIRLIYRTQTADRVLLLAWDHNEIARVKQAHPEIATRALIRARLIDLPTLIKSAGADCVSFSYDLIRPGDVEQVHALGVAIMLAEMWQPDFDFVRNMGVDMVSWGDPIEAKQQLGYVVTQG
jgi:glycerophosphoryl diester phosphodiesterase